MTGRMEAEERKKKEEEELKVKYKTKSHDMELKELDEKAIKELFPDFAEDFEDLKNKIQLDQVILMRRLCLSLMPCCVSSVQWSVLIWRL